MPAQTLFNKSISKSMHGSSTFYFILFLKLVKPVLESGQTCFWNWSNQFWKVVKPVFETSQTSFWNLSNQFWKLVKPFLKSGQTSFGRWSNQFWKVVKPVFFHYALFCFILFHFLSFCFILSHLYFILTELSAQRVVYIDSIQNLVQCKNNTWKNNK